MGDRRDACLEILRFLRDNNLLESSHTLERETGLYFDMEYLKELLNSGNHTEAEKYLSGFAKPGENHNSTTIFYEIRKAIFLHEFERSGRDKAKESLEGLKSLLQDNETQRIEMNELLSLEIVSFWRSKLYFESPFDRGRRSYLSYERASAVTRLKLVRTVEEEIKKNPVFEGKLSLPCIPRRQRWHDEETSESNKSVQSRYNIPSIVALTIDFESTPTSMVFHPHNPALLIVGTSTGDLEFWDLSQRISREQKFKVWKIHRSGLELVTIENAAVKRVVWSPDGLLLGVAYSNGLVQVYLCDDRGSHYIRQKMECVAHADSSINDLALWRPGNDHLVITCGDDHKVQIWDVESGDLKLTLSGHEAPVYSLCPHPTTNVPHFFSMSVDGNVNVWHYKDTEPRCKLRGPVGHVRMAISSDGKRFFACGTNGEAPSLVEFNAGSIVRSYQGLDKRQISVVRCGIAGKLLAVGHDSVIKFWDMNDEKLLLAVEAEGGLLDNPLICFNKKGTLLAVDTTENTIKILATSEEWRTLRSVKRAAELGFFKESGFDGRSSSVEVKRIAKRRG